MSLYELIAPARRVAFVGLAKHTGKTEALMRAARELHAAGCQIGVTSAGYEGRGGDALDAGTPDAGVEKPPIELPAGTLVATTDELLGDSCAHHEVLARTGFRTPIGRVVVARLLREGRVELAGPSAAQDVRVVADAMLVHGAERILIDGAADRRAVAAPSVSDGVVLASAAIADEPIEELVTRTRDAVELLRLPALSDRSDGDRRLRALARARRENLLVEDLRDEPIRLPARIAMAGTAYELGMLLHEHPGARHLILRGAVCEPFLRGLVRAARGRELQLTVQDSTKLFLVRRRLKWFEREGISIRVLTPTRLCALTVSPFAAQARDVDLGRLRALLAQAIPEAPIVDVRERAPELASAA